MDQSKPFKEEWILSENIT